MVLRIDWGGCCCRTTGGVEELSDKKVCRCFHCTKHAMGVDLSTFLLLLLRMLLIFVRQKVFTNDACLPLCLPTKNSVFSKFLCRPPKSDPRGNRKWNRWSHNHHSQEVGSSLRLGPTLWWEHARRNSRTYLLLFHLSSRETPAIITTMIITVKVMVRSWYLAAPWTWRRVIMCCVSLWSQSAHCRKIIIIEREFD